MPRVRSPKAELAAKPVAVVDAPPVPTTESLIADTRRNLAWPPGNAALTWNPDALQSSKGGLTIYDSMRVDEQVQAALSFRVACCIGPGWVLEPATNDPTDREFADLLTRDLIALPGAFERVLRELLTAIAYGYALGEATYRLDDTAMTLATVKVRAPHHLDFEQDAFGNVTGVRQLVMGPSEVVPINKFVHYVNQGEFDNPYGRSDLRAAYKPWFSKSFVWQLWMIWNERYADPPAYVNQPPGTTTQQRDEVLNILNRLQARTSFALPKDWMVALLESGRQPREVFQLAIDRFDLAISRALLIPEKSGISGGANTGGSFSLAQVQADTGVLLRNLEANALAACIQRQLIVPMASYRDATREPPTFKLNPLTEDNVAAITTAFNQAVEKGTIISDGRDENHLRQLLKFPELGEAEQAQRDRQRAQDRAMVQVAAQAKANGGSQTPPDGTPPKGGKPKADATMAERYEPCPHFSGGSGFTYCSTCNRRVASPSRAEMAALLSGFNPADHPRGKTVEGTTPGSFAPKDGTDGSDTAAAEKARKDTGAVQAMLAHGYDDTRGEDIANAAELGDILESHISLRQSEQGKIKAEVASAIESRAGWTDGERTALADLTNKPGMGDYGVAGNLLSQWAQTSGDHNPVAVAIQHAAAKEFGLSDAALEHLGDAATLSVEAESGLRKFVRAQYEHTQDALKAIGVEHVIVTRGAQLRESETPQGWRATSVHLQPMSSFSLQPGVARDFADLGQGAYEGGAFYAIRVPRERVMSTARTGFGAINEQEIVVLGGKLRAHEFGVPAHARGKREGIRAEFTNTAWRDGLAQIYGVAP